jgi:hypothetical protein
MTKGNPAFRGRQLSDEDLAVIRAQVEMFDSIDQIDDEIREIIQERWPDLLSSKIAPERKH